MGSKKEEENSKKKKKIIIIDGQIPFCHSLMFKKFLSLPNRSIRVCVKGERINRRAGCGLEIPAKYIFSGSEKAIQWARWCR